MKTLPHQCEFCETIGLDVELYPFRSVLTYMCRTCAKEQYSKFTGHGVSFDQQPQPQPQRIQRPPRDPELLFKARGYAVVYPTGTRPRPEAPHDICGPGQPCEVWPDCLCGGYPKFYDSKESSPPPFSTRYFHAMKATDLIAYLKEFEYPAINALLDRIKHLNLETIQHGQA